MANEQEIKNGVITPIVKLEETTTPPVDSGKGQLYTKSSDNKLWFVDGLGVDREVGLDNNTYDYYVLNNKASNHLNWLDLKGALENPAYNSVFIHDGTYYAEDDIGGAVYAINNFLSSGQKVTGNNKRDVIIDCSGITSATNTIFYVSSHSSIENITIKELIINSVNDITIFWGGREHKYIYISAASNTGVGNIIGFEKVYYSSFLNSSVIGTSFSDCHHVINPVVDSCVIVNCSFFDNGKYFQDGEETVIFTDCNNFSNIDISASESSTIFDNCHYMYNTKAAIFLTVAADVFINSSNLDGVNITYLAFNDGQYLFNNCENINNIVVDGINSENGIINCKNITNIKLSNFEGCPIQLSDNIDNIELVGNWSGLTANTTLGHISECNNVSNAYIEPAVIAGGFHANAIMGLASAAPSKNYTNIRIVANRSNNQQIGIGMKYINNFSNIFISDCKYQSILNCNKGSKIEIISSEMDSNSDMGVVEQSNYIDDLLINSTPLFSSNSFTDETSYNYESNTVGETGDTAWGSDWTLSLGSGLTQANFVIGPVGVSPLATTSGSTGPEVSVCDGNFIFFESSGITYDENAFAFVEYNPTWTSLSSISFDLHMYGVGVGDLIILSKNEIGKWEEKWVQSGQLQVNGTSAFITQEIDTHSWNSKGIKFMFKEPKSYQADIALDNISFKTSDHLRYGVYSCSNLNNITINADTFTNSIGIGLVSVNTISNARITNCPVGALNVENANNISIFNGDVGIKNSLNLSNLDVSYTNIGLFKCDQVNNVKYGNIYDVVFNNCIGISNVNGDKYNKVEHRTVFEYCQNISAVKIDIEIMLADWIANHNYNVSFGVSHWVLPTTPNGYKYRIEGNGGTSGAVEPVWNTGGASTTSDNGNTWTAFSYDDNYLNYNIFNDCYGVDNIYLIGIFGNANVYSSFVVFSSVINLSNVIFIYMNAYSLPVLFLNSFSIDNVNISTSTSYGSELVGYSFMSGVSNISKIKHEHFFTGDLPPKAHSMYIFMKSVTDFTSNISFNGTSLTAAVIYVFSDSENLTNIDITVRNVVFSGAANFVFALNDTSRVNNGIIHYENLQSGTEPSRMMGGTFQNIRGLELKGTNVINKTYGVFSGNQIIGCYGFDDGDFDVSAGFFVNSGFNDWTL